MTISWIEYKSKKILFNDMKGSSEEQMVKQFNQEVEMLKAAGGKVLLLVDIEGASAGRDFMDLVKSKGKEIEQYIEKQAIIGVDTIKSILIKGYNLATGSNMKPCKNENEAKEYLVG